MFAKILVDTFIGGQPVYAGDKYDLDQETFTQLKRCKRIEPCEAPPEHVPEPVKPKVKKVS